MPRRDADLRRRPALGRLLRGRVVPAAETCNNQDDDCNGTTDDGADRRLHASPTPPRRAARGCPSAACATGFGDYDAAAANGCGRRSPPRPITASRAAARCAAGQNLRGRALRRRLGGRPRGGGANACAILLAGAWRAGALDQYGQLGNRCHRPPRGARVRPGLNDATDVEAGARAHVCAIRAGGAVVCWGEKRQLPPRRRHQH